MTLKNAVQRYRETQKFWVRDERIEFKDETIKTEESDVPVETYDYVKRVIFPDWMGTKINIFV